MWSESYTDDRGKDCDWDCGAPHRNLVGREGSRLNRDSKNLNKRAANGGDEGTGGVSWRVSLCGLAEGNIRSPVGATAKWGKECDTYHTLLSSHNYPAGIVIKRRRFSINFCEEPMSEQKGGKWGKLWFYNLQRDCNLANFMVFASEVTSVYWYRLAFR